MKWTPLELEAIEGIRGLLEKEDWPQAVSKIIDGHWSSYITRRILTSLGYIYDPNKFRIIYKLGGGAYYLFLPKEFNPGTDLVPFLAAVAVIGVDTKSPCEEEGRQNLFKIVEGQGIGPQDMDQIYLEVVKKAQWIGVK